MTENFTGIEKLVAQLWIDTGEEDPSIITELTGIEPSFVQAKGQRWFLPHKNEYSEKIISKENCWVLMKEIQQPGEAVYPDTVIIQLLEVINTRKEIFTSLLKGKKYDGVISAYHYYHNFHEFINLNRDVIRQLSDYNLTCVFDLYHFKNESADVR